VIIRKARLEDADALAEIHVRAWQSAYRGMMSDVFLDGLSVTDRAAGWRTWLVSEDVQRVLVVEPGQLAEPGLAGFCVFGKSRDADLANSNAAELYAINVHPQYWRHGYGSSLCNEVINQVVSAAWSALSLWVIRDNHRAREFYQAMGFVADGIERIDSGLIGESLHELRYVRTITDARV